MRSDDATKPCPILIAFPAFIRVMMDGRDVVLWKGDEEEERAVMVGRLSPPWAKMLAAELHRVAELIYAREGLRDPEPDGAALAAEGESDAE